MSCVTTPHMWTGQDLPTCPPRGHNDVTSGHWIIIRGHSDRWRGTLLLYPELPEDAPSPLFRGPEEPLEPGEVFEEEEFWAEGLWDEMWEELNGKTYLVWTSNLKDRRGEFSSGCRFLRQSHRNQYKIQKKERSRKNDNYHKRRYHQIKQPGGSSCNQR